MYLEDEKTTPVIDATLACYRACLGMAKSGSDGASGAHLDLLTECAAVSREAAHQLIAGSVGATTLLQSAEVSDRCGEACEQIDGMEECGAVCRWCASSCRNFAS
jgi:hypothetical protein